MEQARPEYQGGEGVPAALLRACSLLVTGSPLVRRSGIRLPFSGFEWRGSLLVRRSLPVVGAASIRWGASAFELSISIYFRQTERVKRSQASPYRCQ